MNSSMVADSQDSMKTQRRGRRGLDVLQRIQKMTFMSRCRLAEERLSRKSAKST